MYVQHIEIKREHSIIMNSYNLFTIYFCKQSGYWSGRKSVRVRARVRARARVRVGLGSGGRLQSLDWTGGLDQWTGLDWTGLEWTGLDSA